MEMVKSGNKKLGIFGGTFDPVHIGHLAIAEKAREQFSLSRVLFIPVFKHPYSNKKIYAEPEHRLEMLKIALSTNPFFEISDIEIKREGPSYTFETVKILEEQNPETQFFLIVGIDAFFDFPNWYKAEQLAEKVKLLVAHREKKITDIENVKEIVKSKLKNFPEFYFIKSPLINISSSYIRNCLSEKKTVKYLIPDRVLEYIKKESLYER